MERAERNLNARVSFETYQAAILASEEEGHNLSSWVRACVADRLNGRNTVLGAAHSLVGLEPGTYTVTVSNRETGGKQIVIEPAEA